MRKNGWVILVVLALLAVPAFVSAQSRPGHEPKPIIINQAGVGTITMERVASPPNPDTVMGIQKTINIPASAFVVNDLSYATFGYVTSYYGYLYGESNSYYTYLTAPIVFPKGAKKIQRIDFYIWDDYGSGVYLSAWDQTPYVSNSHQMCYGTTDYSGAWIKYSWAPAKPYYMIYPTHSYYVYVGVLYDAYIQEVVVTWQ
jgi:hypothetical protein